MNGQIWKTAAHFAFSLFHPLYIYVYIYVILLLGHKEPDYN